MAWPDQGEGRCGGRRLPRVAVNKLAWLLMTIFLPLGRDSKGGSLAWSYCAGVRPASLPWEENGIGWGADPSRAHGSLCWGFKWKEGRDLLLLFLCDPWMEPLKDPLQRLAVPWSPLSRKWPPHGDGDAGTTHRLQGWSLKLGSYAHILKNREEWSGSFWPGFGFQSFWKQMGFACARLTWTQEVSCSPKLCNILIRTFFLLHQSLASEYACVWWQTAEPHFYSVTISLSISKNAI